MHTFGEVLRKWRRRRRFSQLELALLSNVSARHISYLETGKASPSREMVLKLCRVVAAPRHERNVWLMAAGFAPLFQARSLDDQELHPFRSAVTRLLDRHDPFPGWALDSDWRVIAANISGKSLLNRLGISVGGSIIAALRSDPTLGGALENWREAVAHLAARLGAEARRRADAEAARAALQLSSIAEWESGDHPLPAAVPTRINDEGKVISLISLQALFNTAEDVTLADLRVELFFPADSESERALVEMTDR